MKRFRSSTLMLLVAVVALGAALVVEHGRHRRREAEFQNCLAAQEKEFTLKSYLLKKRYMNLQAELEKQLRIVGGADGDK